MFGDVLSEATQGLYRDTSPDTPLKNVGEHGADDTKMAGDTLTSAILRILDPGPSR